MTNPTGSSPDRLEIAVTGIAAIFPGSNDAAGFWRDIVDGRDLIREVPESHWLKEDYYDPDPAVPDKTYAFRGAFLDPVPFDPLEWGVPPSIVPATDTTQLIALMVAKRVLEDATGGKWPNVDREKISCILGCTSGQELMGTMSNRLQHPIWADALRELGYPESEVKAIVAKISDHYVPWQESTFPGLLGNVVAGRIANRLDLGGTNCITDAACASSFSAMSMAVNELVLGHADLVITGGADTMNDIFMYMCFSKTPALSMSGECAPFSEKSDGTLLGEGFGMVALKRLADAERDGDRIYAVLRGIGTSSDGRSKSVYAPVPVGQAKALRRTYEQAGYPASTVELVEAHGTGTKAGDAAEFEALKTAFDETGRKDRQWCALGTVKSQIGHTKAAAGAAGLFKAVMSLHHKILPPTLKIGIPNPKLGIDDSPFYLNTKTRPWIRGADHPRRASVSSFGFGGSNFHVALEEYTGPTRAARLRAAPTELVVLSAATPEALARDARAMAKNADRRGWLQFVAYQGHQADHADKPARLAVVAADEAELRLKLDQVADRIEKAPTEPFLLPTGSYYATGEQPGAVGFLFPGQGSQYVGMGGDLAMADERARAVWDRSSDLRLAREALEDVVFPHPVFNAEAEKKQEERLRATEWAQPAIGVASLALLAVLDALGIRADQVGGHSYGEITALGAAGVLSHDDVLRVARKRGELMAAAAASDGAMTAVPRPIEEVRAHVAAVPGCSIANHNAPAQVVVSGTTAAVSALEKRLLGVGIEAKRLSVATAFHSHVVQGSVEPFSAFLKDISFGTPVVPAYHNATAAPYPADPDRIRAGLAGAIAEPVRFVEQVEAMWAAGVRTFVEVGPHSVLTGLVTEILGDRPHVAVNLDRRKKHGLTALQLGVGRLFTSGMPLRLAALWDGYAIPDDPHLRPVPKMALSVDGSNYGKPYPPQGGAKARHKPNPARTGFARKQVPEPTVVEKVVERVVQVPVAVAADSLSLSAAPAPIAPSGGPMSNHPASPTDPWILAFQEAQRATVDAHAAYQRAMADSHAQFLQTLETSFTGLARMVGAPMPEVHRAAVTSPVLPAAMALPAPRPTQVPASSLFAASPVAAPAWTPAQSAPDLGGLVQSGVDVMRRPSVAPAPVPVAASPAVDLEKLLLEVVAEKTGYPAEMLGMHMALESDLGVDSIKRVEILSAVRERAPGLPEVDAAEMARLQTLGQVVDHLRSALPAGRSVAPVPAAAAVDVEKLLLEVVAEKTGYPAEMLGMHMALESDLGVDSIKRVEILSAVRERAPGLPEVDAAEMARLQTLGQVVEHLRAALPSRPSVPVPVPASASVDIEKLLLEVVAEKTGYPAEMLGMHMALESDLGVDSIKRVEILSAVRERAPGLPEVDAAEMARLQTLGQVVEHLRATLPSGGPGAAKPSAPAVVDVEKLLLEVVAEKTGYPAEMLGMHMALESDLGVDSIKRVEILSAVRERAPGLPEVDAAEMAKLQTLGQVVEHLRATLPAGPAAKPGIAALQAPAAPPAREPEPPLDPALGRWELESYEAPALGLSMPGLSPTAKIAVQPAGPLADAVGAELRSRGLTVDPSDPDVLILTHGMLDGDPDQALRDAFLAAKGAAVGFTLRGGQLVTVQDTGGDFGLGGSDRAAFGGLAGLAKTGAQEWATTSCKAVDLERGDRSDADLARVLVDELLRGGVEPEVGLRADGRRLALRSVKRAVVHGDVVLNRGDVVVATGGARGVTAACLIALARERSGLRFALLGRTPLADESGSTRSVADEPGLKKVLLADAKGRGETPTPAVLGKRVAAILAGREVRATLDALGSAGAEARYLAVDVNDPAAVRSALAQIRSSWGPVAGLVHGAGVLADKLIAEKTPEAFDQVYATKVVGLRTLLDAMSDDPLRAIVLFSSVAGRCGNRGQVDYAMANEVLAKIAELEARRRPDAVVKALQWGPWEGGMVTGELKARFASLGVPLIPIAAGARWMVQELGSRAGVEVVLGGEPRMAALAEAGGTRTLTLRTRVDQATHPYLADHEVAGQPVLPVVVALEWFARAANAARPDLALVELRDVKVLRGVRLDGFRGDGDWFDVTAREISNGTGSTLALTLTRPGQAAPHYSATATMADRFATAPRAPAMPTHDPVAGSVYDGRVLFHGKRFQVIQDLTLSDRGATADLASTADLGWTDEPWTTDPAGLDGGLQLALLWSDRVLGGPSLPMGLSAMKTFGDGLHGPLRAVLTGEKRGADKAVTDIVFLDRDGKVVHELRGVETILRPS